MTTITPEILAKYVADKLINEQVHPNFPHIKLYNYTPECQFSKQWDEITMMCRGLILNTQTNEIVARPFGKFFNYEEHIAAGKEVPIDPFPIVTEKLDGSLGILYFIEGIPYIATRGSFVSEQAQWATAWLKDKDLSVFNTNFTYLFEIIYPENRIVVSYDFSGLVLLAIINTANGSETWIDEDHPIRKEFRVRKTHDGNDITKLKELNISNAEGFVVQYPTSGLRLKIKFDEYVKLHKTMTGLSEIGVWEMLKEKGIDTTAKELVADMPDEFYGWLTSVVDRLQKEFHALEHISKVIADVARELPTRKEQALYITEASNYPGIAFTMLDNKPYADGIFRLIRPRGVRTFTQDVDK